jgi:hypothetical protein
MGGVIAPDAENAAHGESPTTLNRHARHGRRSNHECVRHVSILRAGSGARFFASFLQKRRFFFL